MTKTEYEEAREQIMLIGRLTRNIPLAAFLTHAEHAEAHGALFTPSHWIAGHKKLGLEIRLAQKLQAFQAVLPTLDEALKLDEDAKRDAKRLGIEP